MELEAEEFMRFIASPPVVLVSTLYQGKVKNVAPFGMVMPVSSRPPMIVLGVAESRDTFSNIQDTGEFVVGIPGPDMVAQINKTADRYPRDVSEFEQAGLTPVESRTVKAYRIQECQVNLECKLEWLEQAGDHYVVVGRVVAAQVDDGMSPQGTRADLDPVYHVRGRVYARKGEIIDPQRPGSG